MTNEYLFLSNEHRDIIEQYRPDDVTVEIDDKTNTAFWVAKYTVANNDEAGAKILSDVGIFLSDFAPVILSCESSEYYNHELFPLVNELERKLRKLVYLAVFKSGNADSQKLVANLEEKDFGAIFELLFIDQDFVSGIKGRINGSKGSGFEGKGSYSKREIQKHLDSAEENTLWVQILGADTVPTLQDRFRDVQSFRNSVMHAHNVDSEHYSDAKSLFIKINKEQDEAIKNLLKPPKSSSDEVKRDTTLLMATAMQKHLASSITELVKSLPSANPQYFSSIQKAFKTYFDSPSYQAVKAASANSALLSFQKTLQSYFDSPAYQMQKEILNSSAYKMAQEIQKMKLPAFEKIYELEQLQKQLKVEIEPYEEFLEEHESFLSDISESDSLSDELVSEDNPNDNETTENEEDDTDERAE